MEMTSLAQLLELYIKSVENSLQNAHKRIIYIYYIMAI